MNLQTIDSLKNNRTSLENVVSSLAEFRQKLLNNRMVVTLEDINNLDNLRASVVGAMALMEASINEYEQSAKNQQIEELLNPPQPTAIALDPVEAEEELVEPEETEEPLLVKEPLSIEEALPVATKEVITTDGDGKTKQVTSVKK